MKRKSDLAYQALAHHEFKMLTIAFISMMPLSLLGKKLTKLNLFDKEVVLLSCGPPHTYTSIKYDFANLACSLSLSVRDCHI